MGGVDPQTPSSLSPAHTPVHRLYSYSYLDILSHSTFHPSIQPRQSSWKNPPEHTGQRYKGTERRNGLSEQPHPFTPLASLNSLQSPFGRAFTT